MTFLVTETAAFDSDFIATALALGELQLQYNESREKALRLRMELIGRAEEQREKYPQRSAEARYIQKGYESNGWSEDVIKKNRAAWRAYKTFSENINPEIKALAEQSTFSHLYELSLDESGAMWWNAMRYLKRCKEMPSVKQLRGFRGGFTDDNFNFRTHKGASLSATNIDQGHQSQVGIQNSIPAVLTRTSDHSREIVATYQELKPLQDTSELTVKQKIQQFTELLGAVSWDDVSVDQELVEMLQPWHGILEVITAIAEIRKPVSRYF